MISWLVRAALIVAGAIVGVFVAKDAPIFDVVQMIVALFVIALTVFVLAFWPARWTHLLDGKGDEPQAGG